MPPLPSPPTALLGAVRTEDLQLHSSASASAIGINPTVKLRVRPPAQPRGAPAPAAMGNSGGGGDSGGGAGKPGRVGGGAEGREGEGGAAALSTTPPRGHLHLKKQRLSFGDELEEEEGAQGVWAWHGVW